MDPELTLAERFEQVARRFPDNIAIKSESSAITYAHLNSKSDQLAAQINNRLTQEVNTFAAVFHDVRNAIGLAITYIGAVKSGKLCFSLNSSENIQGDLLSAKPPVVITDTENISAVQKLRSPDWEPTIWNIDDLKDESVQTVPPPSNSARIPLDSPSYVFFTSGTSGPPKGVIRTYRGEILTALAVSQLHNLTSKDISTCFRNNSAGLNDMLIGLLNGMQVCCRDIFVKERLEDFADWLNEEKVTLLRIVSSAYKYLVRDGKKLPHVRIVDIGGEMVTPIYFEAFKESFSEACQFRPRYSATEAQTMMFGDLGHESKVGELIPYTITLEHNEMFIFDERRQSLPPGEVGEIAVRSPAVGLGYWENPELTREKFIPVKDDPSRRIYLTRDRGVMKDGSLFVLGKTDLPADTEVLQKLLRKLR